MTSDPRKPPAPTAPSAPRPRVRIAAVLIARNEEARIATALASVAWMDRLVVVDSFSTDATREVASRFTSHVICRDFDDYSSQRNFGAEQACADWVFAIDADETVTPELRSEIESILADPSAPHNAYAVPRRNVYFGRPLTHVMGLDAPIRLYQPDTARFEGAVHEKVQSAAPPGTLHAQLLHESCTTYAEWVARHRRYVRLQARELFAAGRRFSLLRLLLSPPRVFFLRAIRLRGWRDGPPGLAVAAEMALSIARQELHLRALDRGQ